MRGKESRSAPLSNRRCERKRSNPLSRKLRKMDCFVARAPRNDETQFRDLAACFRARCSYFPPSSIRGRGEAGRPMRPIAACANVVVESTRVSQVTPESPGTPHAVVYAYTCSPRRSGLGLSPSLALLLANLTPALRRQDHTISPSASRAFVKGAIRVHRIPVPR
jgi:hypothetical protein